MQYWFYVSFGILFIIAIGCAMWSMYDYNKTMSVLYPDKEGE